MVRPLPLKRGGSAKWRIASLRIVILMGDIHVQHTRKTSQNNKIGQQINGVSYHMDSFTTLPYDYNSTT